MPIRLDDWCFTHQVRHTSGGGVLRYIDATCKVIGEVEVALRIALRNIGRADNIMLGRRYPDFCSGCWEHEYFHVNGRCIILPGKFFNEPI
jgi:hypothetical protein